MPLVHEKLTANFTMTATQQFYETAAAADAAAAAGNGPIQGQGGINFKDTAAARRQLCKKTPDRG
jgi:hypothetical protein